MKDPRLAAPVAALALAAQLASCTGAGDNFANDEALAADREAAAEMVQTVLDVHAGDMNSRRPARLVMGSWQYVAEVNTDWSHRLANALRELEEKMMEDSPEAPWLLSSGGADKSGVLFAVYDTEDRSSCCRTVPVDVELRNGKLEFRTSDRVGYIDFVDPPQTVVESILAKEQRYMRDRDAERVRKK